MLCVCVRPSGLRVSLFAERRVVTELLAQKEKQKTEWVAALAQSRWPRELRVADFFQLLLKCQGATFKTHNRAQCSSISDSITIVSFCLQVPL